MENSSNSKFTIGESVSVLANTFSKHAPDHQEQAWAGTVQSVHETPVDSGEVVRSYNVLPDDGGLPRNVLESRLKPAAP